MGIGVPIAHQFLILLRKEARKGTSKATVSAIAAVIGAGGAGGEEGEEDGVPENGRRLEDGSSGERSRGAVEETAEREEPPDVAHGGEHGFWSGKEQE